MLDYVSHIDATIKINRLWGGIALSYQLPLSILFISNTNK